MDTATFRAMKLSPETALEKCIDEQPMVLERMKRAERVSPVYSAGDYSYRNTKLFGDRWLLVGDAAGFIDPVFSSGVFFGDHVRRKGRRHTRRGFARRIAQASPFSKGMRALSITSWISISLS